MRYAKAAVALVAVVASYLVAHFAGGTLNPTEWGNVVLAGLTASGVYIGPNTPAAPVTKSAHATLGVIFTAVNSALVPGTPVAAWWQLVVAAASALGVHFVPNKAVAGAS